MNREQYAEAQKVLADVQHELATAPLTLEQRKELELHAARLAGVLLSPWLPVTFKSRLIALGIIALGFCCRSFRRAS
jgi:hypothetical protein